MANNNLDESTSREVEAVRDYWDSHPLGKQYVTEDVSRFLWKLNSDVGLRAIG